MTKAAAAPAPADDEERKESDQAEERSAPSGRAVYKAILTEGESAFERTSSALTPFAEASRLW